jgi:hypothetical protein
LYLYNIKIQTNTKQNEVENCAGKSQNFLKKISFFWDFFAGLDLAQKETGPKSALK